MDERNDILRLLAKKEKEFERNKLKRFAFTVLLYAVLFFVVAYLQTDGGSISDLLGIFVVCLICSIIMVLISSFVFHWLFTTSEREDNYLQELKNELAFIDHNKK